MASAENLLGCSFIIKGKIRKGKRPFFSFLSRHHVFIVSSSSRMGRRVFLSLPGQASHYGKIISGLSTMRVFHFEVSPFHKLLFSLCMQRACPRYH